MAQVVPMQVDGLRLDAADGHKTDATPVFSNEVGEATKTIQRAWTLKCEIYWATRLSSPPNVTTTSDSKRCRLRRSEWRRARHLRRWGAVG